MNVDFVRFQATDGLELQGWLSDAKGEKAVIHIHGMSGNGYENYFLDVLRAMYTAHGISFFTIDTRGRGIISSFWKGNESILAGSCFEIFEESVHDIQGAIDYLRSLGKKEIVLQGHSLGGSKVVHYLVSKKDPSVKAAILLAPTDMVGWAKTDPHNTKYVAKAKELIAQGKVEELVSSQCWLDKTSISAQTYETICGAGKAVDIYGHGGDAVLGNVTTPMLIVYGDNDIGITEIDGTIGVWEKRIEKIKHSNTEIAIIKGAPHGFKIFEEKLAQTIERFVVSKT